MGCRLGVPLPPSLSSLGFPLLLFPFLPFFPPFSYLPALLHLPGRIAAGGRQCCPHPPYSVPTPRGPRGPLPSSAAWGSQDPLSIPTSCLVQPLLCCLSLLWTTVLSPALIPSCPHTSPFCLHRGPTAPCPLHPVFPPLPPPTTGKDTARRESLRVHRAHPSRSLTSTSLRTSLPVMGSNRPSRTQHPCLPGWAGVWCHPAPICSGSAPGHQPVLSRSEPNEVFLGPTPCPAIPQGPGAMGHPLEALAGTGAPIPRCPVHAGRRSLAALSHSGLRAGAGAWPEPQRSGLRP